MTQAMGANHAAEIKKIDEILSNNETAGFIEEVPEVEPQIDIFAGDLLVKHNQSDENQASDVAQESLMVEQKNETVDEVQTTNIEEASTHENDIVDEFASMIEEASVPEHKMDTSDELETTIINTIEVQNSDVTIEAERDSPLSPLPDASTIQEVYDVSSTELNSTMVIIEEPLNDDDTQIRPVENIIIGPKALAGSNYSFSVSGVPENISTTTVDVVNEITVCHEIHQHSVVPPRDEADDENLNKRKREVNTRSCEEEESSDDEEKACKKIKDSKYYPKIRKEIIQELIDIMKSSESSL
jgi:hypothetical protein